MTPALPELSRGWVQLSKGPSEQTERTCDFLHASFWVHACWAWSLKLHGLGRQGEGSSQLRLGVKQSCTEWCVDGSKSIIDKITTSRQAKGISPGVKASILTTKTKKIIYVSVLRAKKIHPPIQTNTYQATSHRNHTSKPENSAMLQNESWWGKQA